MFTNLLTPTVRVGFDTRYHLHSRIIPHNVPTIEGGLPRDTSRWHTGGLNVN